MKMSLKQVFGVVACALCLGGTANAGVLYDNLSAVSNGSDRVGAFGPLADSFSTTGATTLVYVKVLLTNGGNAGTGTVDVSLLDDDAGSPGNFLAALGSISDNSITAALTIFDLPQAPGIGLAANTRYWIELSTSDNSTAEWSWSFDTTGPGVADEFYANVAGVSPNEDGPYQMQLLGASAVPEPSTLLGGSLVALLGLAALRRERAAA